MQGRSTLPLPRCRGHQTWRGAREAAGQGRTLQRGVSLDGGLRNLSVSAPRSQLASSPTALFSPHLHSSHPKTRRAPLRGRFGYPGGGNPRQIGRRRRSAAMLLTLCSRARRLGSHGVPLFLRHREALFSAAGERSAMSGKFREGLDGATLPALGGRPRAALCTR